MLALLGFGMSSSLLAQPSDAIDPILEIPPKFESLRLVTPNSPSSSSPRPPDEPERARVLPTQLPPLTDSEFFVALADIEYLSDDERVIVAETNRLRTDPRGYAEELANLLPYFDGMMLNLPELPPLQTYEGAAVVEEAIAVLQETDPLPPLTVSGGMSQAARDHVADLGAIGAEGHYGSDGSTPFERLNRYGTWEHGNGSRAGENISYSPFEIARWHVMQLVIDDGVPNRGHRQALLRPEYQVTGVACGEHIAYGTMCSITYATKYTDAE